MANVVLRGIQKIYPNSEKVKKQKKDSSENLQENKTGCLQVTEKGVVAVQNFSLEIADKEFVVLVGPSGCGKSTTLRMIAGLEEITEGELYIDGVLVNELAPKDRDIAMVFQNYALYPPKRVVKDFLIKFTKKPQKSARKQILAPDTLADGLFSPA